MIGPPEDKRPKIDTISESKNRLNTIEKSWNLT